MPPDAGTTGFRTGAPPRSPPDGPVEAATAPAAARRVVFVQKFVPHYRLGFFEGVRAELARRGIELVLVHGPPDPYEGSKVRTVSPDWGVRVDTRHLHVRGRWLYRQRAGRFVRRGDLVVVEHAAKLLDNYGLYARCLAGRIRMSYFGHGENFQSVHELGTSRTLKRAMLHVTRWFAYTEVSRRSLLSQGVKDERITVVNNTLAAPELPAPMPERAPGRCLYVGGLYEDKRLGFLISSCARVAERVEGFELHVVGAGPLEALVREAAARHPWLVHHGALYGEERARLLGSSQAILMPGLVGLVAIDSFHFGAPLITSHAGQHSPEIAYLEDDVNALFDGADGDEASYAALVERFLGDATLAERLRRACARSAATYTLERMVQRFCDGAERCFGPAGAPPGERGGPA